MYFILLIGKHSAEKGSQAAPDSMRGSRDKKFQSHCSLNDCMSHGPPSQDSPTPFLGGPANPHRGTV